MTSIATSCKQTNTSLLAADPACERTCWKTFLNRLVRASELHRRQYGRSYCSCMLYIRCIKLRITRQDHGFYGQDPLRPYTAVDRTVSRLCKFCTALITDSLQDLSSSFLMQQVFVDTSENHFCSRGHMFKKLSSRL